MKDNDDKKEEEKEEEIEEEKRNDVRLAEIKEATNNVISTMKSERETAKRLKKNSPPRAIGFYEMYQHEIASVLMILISFVNVYACIKLFSSWFFFILLLAFFLLTLFIPDISDVIMYHQIRYTSEIYLGIRNLGNRIFKR